MSNAAEKTEVLNVVVGCRLPHGLIIELAQKGKKDTEKLRLAGRKHSNLKNAPYGVTAVPKDFMDEWLKRNKKFPALESGAILVAADEVSLEAMFREHEKRRIGFEQMPQEQKATGLKKATTDD